MHEIQPDWYIIVSNCFEHWCFPFMDTKLNKVYSCRNSFWLDLVWSLTTSICCEQCWIQSNLVTVLMFCALFPSGGCNKCSALKCCHIVTQLSATRQITHCILNYNEWKIECQKYLLIQVRFIIISPFVIYFNSEGFFLLVIVWMTFYIIIVLGFWPHLNVTCQLDQEEFLD